MRHDFRKDFCDDDIHDFFGLSYANYLTLPRSILQSMSAKWQHKFTELLYELEDLYGGSMPLNYTVHARDDDGRFVHDPLADYERGRRYIEPTKVTKEKE